MAGAEEGLEGMGVEDAAGDEILEQALEVFGASDTGGEPSDDVMLEETEGQQGEGEAESGGDMAESGGAQDGAESSGDMARSGGTQGGTVSDAEELATLNRELDQALEKFDGAILTERNTVANQENTAAGGAPMGEEDGGTGAEGEPGTGEESMAQNQGTGSADPTDSGEGGIPASPGSRGQGEYRHTASADTVPANIPDGSDDDVVARQIREAAMAETDPELREKLWEEYRKYKKN